MAKLTDAIQIVETSPGLYCVRVSWAGLTFEATELSHEDAWPTGHDALCEMIGEAA